jgi:hypothetical protein
VSHQFLLYAHGCSGFVEPGTISVAEGVKPDPAKSPGAGKSTLLLRLAEMAWSDPALVGLTHRYIPLPIRLRHLLPTSGTVDNRLRSALTNDKLFNISGDSLPPTFYAEWPRSKNARWLVLLDGFDEIQTEARESIAAELRSLVNFLIRDGHSVVITSRPKSLARTFSDIFPTFSIAPLEEEQEVSLSSHYLGSATQSFLKQYPELNVGSSARTPLLLAIAISIFRKRKDGRLPLRQIDLFAEFVAQCIDESRSRGLEPEANNSPRECLQRIALATTQNIGVPSEDTLVSTFGGASSQDFRKFLRRVGQHSGLLHYREASYDWLHPTFREYLAACQIADTVSADEVKACGYVRLWEKSNWHQVVLFLLQIWSSRNQSINTLVERVANLDEKGLFFAASLIPEGVDVGPVLKKAIFEGLLGLTRALNRMVWPNYMMGVVVNRESPLPSIGLLRNNEFIAREIIGLVRDRSLQPWLRTELIKTIAGPAVATSVVSPTTILIIIQRLRKTCQNS